MDGFSPLDTLKLNLRYWWWLVLGMLLGALAGEVFHAWQPEKYESRAALAASINHVQTGKLTDIEQDQLIGMVGDVVYSSSVLEAVVAQAQKDGLSVDLQQLRQSMFLERRDYVWLVRVRYRDAEGAMRLANAWADAAAQVLADALKHAILADRYQRALDSLENCLEAVVAEPVQVFCNLSNLAQIQSEMQRLGGQVYQERLASQGISSAIGFSVVEKNVLLPKAVLYERAVLVFSGGLVGFLLAVAAVSARLPERWGKKQ